MAIGKGPYHIFLVTCAILCILTCLISVSSNSTTKATTGGSPTVTTKSSSAAGSQTVPAQNTSSSVPSSTQPTFRSPCDELKQDPNTYLHLHPVYEEGLCFFIVNGSTAVSSTKAQSGKYEFNMTAAREVCNSVNATLPIVSNKYIAYRLLAFSDDAELRNVDGLTELLGVVLGLKQNASSSNVSYAWDDGTSSDYAAASNWNSDETAEFTILLKDVTDQEQRRDNDYGFQWRNFASNVTDKVVAVACQKTTNQSFVGPCDQSTWRRDKYRGERFCYFVVPGAVDEANRNESGGYIFDKQKASDICKKYDATLPTPIDKHEHLQLLIIQAMDRDSDANALDALVLGISQTINGPNVTYSWDGGPDLQFFAYQDHPQWPTKFSVVPSAYTQMEYTTYRWTNKMENETQANPVQVWCQQRFGFIPPTAVQNHSRCLWGKSADYPFVQVYQNRHCYFYGHLAERIAGETIPLPPRSRPPRSHYFEIGLARRYCEHQGATLPIIESEEEERWLKKMVAQEENGLQMFSIIPLQLRQVANLQDYRWGPNQPLKYNKTNWRSKDKYAYYTYLDLNSTNLDWVNVQAPIVNRSVKYLCKQQDVGTVCVGNEPSIAKKTISNENVCYFVVKGVLNESNTATGNSSYIFNIDKARKMCELHNAKLPAIHDLEEHEFLVRNYKTFLSGQDRGYIILGMKQMHTEKDKTTYFQYEWDDGSEFKFEALWPGKHAKAGYTAMYLDYLGENNTIPIVEWKNLPKNQSIDSQVNVVCYQVHGDRPAPTPTAFQLKDKCTKAAMCRYHAAAARPEFGACFFVVPNATLHSNFRINQTTHAFNMSHARKICQEHGASVITNISSTDEVRVIIDLFFDTFCKHELLDTDIMFAIDLVQAAHPTDYKWWNNSNLSNISENLEPDEWIDKDSYAFFTTAYIEQKADKQIIVFKNFKHYTVDKPVAVVCRHPAFPQPPAPPLPTTATVSSPDTPQSPGPTPTKPAPDGPDSPQPTNAPRATVTHPPATETTKSTDKANLSMGAPTLLSLIVLAAIIDY